MGSTETENNNGTTEKNLTTCITMLVPRILKLSSTAQKLKTGQDQKAGTQFDVHSLEETKLATAESKNFQETLQGLKFPIPGVPLQYDQSVPISLAAIVNGVSSHKSSGYENGTVKRKKNDHIESTSEEPAPKLQREYEHRLLVENIPLEVSKSMLAEHFNKFVKVLKVKLSKGKEEKTTSATEQECVATVIFKKEVDIDAVLKADHQALGQRVTLVRGKYPSSAVIRGAAPSISKNSLLQHMRQHCGRVKYVVLHAATASSAIITVVPRDAGADPVDNSDAATGDAATGDAPGGVAAVLAHRHKMCGRSLLVSECPASQVPNPELNGNNACPNMTQNKRPKSSNASIYRRDDNYPPHTICALGLPATATRASVEAYFSKYGRVMSMMMLTGDRREAAHAYLTFDTEGAKDAALVLRRKAGRPEGMTTVAAERKLSIQMTKIEVTKVPDFLKYRYSPTLHVSDLSPLTKERDLSAHFKQYNVRGVEKCGNSMIVHFFQARGLAAALSATHRIHGRTVTVRR